MKSERSELLTPAKTGLTKKVITYPTPLKVTLSNFQMDWFTMTGSFALSLDTKMVASRFKLFIDDSGRLKFSAPSSDAIIDLTHATKNAINDAISLLVPRFSGLGLHACPPERPCLATPLTARIIDHEGLEIAKRLICGVNFSVTVGTQANQHRPLKGL